MMISLAFQWLWFVITASAVCGCCERRLDQEDGEWTQGSTFICNDCWKGAE